MVLLANEVAKPVTDPVFWTLLVAALDGAADEATWFVEAAGAALDGAADEATWLVVAGALDGAADEATWFVAAGALDGTTDEATWFVAAGALDGATDEAACCCLLICGAAELAAWFALVATEALLAAEAGLL